MDFQAWLGNSTFSNILWFTGVSDMRCNQKIVVNLLSPPWLYMMWEGHVQVYELQSARNVGSLWSAYFSCVDVLHLEYNQCFSWWSWNQNLGANISEGNEVILCFFSLPQFLSLLPAGGYFRNGLRINSFCTALSTGQVIADLKLFFVSNGAYRDQVQHMYIWTLLQKFV